MKKIILIAFITFITKSAFYQDLERCKAIVKITAQAINNQSSDIFEQQLADDFEMAGHKGEIGKLVASQLLEQLNDTVTSFEEIKEEFTDDTLTLTYVFNYTDKGQQ
ncbi:nuclear transport factor 2 family protein [Flavobacteriaceae bacterium]|nr:nuclear transport factor 2 family protein [Flavobacteriaceae bacterium]